MLKPGLLATKLHRPALPAAWVRRRRLVARLDSGLALGRRVTLVSAPAGFGKTTCICGWLDGLAGWPVAWLSLEPADDEPLRFATYLVAALQQAHPHLGRELAGALAAGQLPPVELIVTTLVNELLAAEARLLLVLDDLHVIQDPFNLGLLEQLLAHQPPALHLVLLTREDPPLPLARLRAANRLTELRARDLRFTGANVARFLNDGMALALSPAEVETLAQRTEGWIAGLQLAALALQAEAAGDAGDAAAFIAALSGSHRYILGYLTEQVLDRLPAETRAFLLQTAILERLNGALCSAVTGRDDAEELLRQLLRANLFLVPLDERGRWYRYHHLFRDLLRELQGSLPPAEIAARHRRAARWYAAAAAEETDGRLLLVDSAMNHALAARDVPLAVDLLEHHARDMLRQGHARTLDEWVRAIPPAQRARSPQTDAALAWMHLLRGAYAEAAPYLARVEAALAEPPAAAGEPALRAEWLVMGALVGLMEGTLPQAEAQAREALAAAPPDDTHVTALAHFALASILRAREAYDPAVAAYRAAIRDARAAGNPVAEMLSTVGLSEMAFAHGQLHLAFEIAAPAIARLEGASALPPISGVLYGILGDVHYQWNRLDEAERYTNRALQLSTLGGYNSGQIACRVMACRLAQISGDLEAADRELRHAADLVTGPLPDYVQHELTAQQVRLYLDRGRPDAARLALQGAGFTFAPAPAFPPGLGLNNLFHGAGLLGNSALRYLLYRARAEKDAFALEHGLELAGQLLAGAIAARARIAALETHLLRAQMAALVPAVELPAAKLPPTANGSQAEADIIAALELAEPEGIIAAFLEQGPPVARILARLRDRGRLAHVAPGYLERLLTAFVAAFPAELEGLPAAAAPPVEPLSDRELEVLRLMAAGLTYKQIAAELTISLNTVRFHVKAVYGKLGVNKRALAVAKAQALRIL